MITQSFRCLPILLFCLTSASSAQDAGAGYKNFKHPPPGQYRQTFSGEMNGRATPPQQQTICTSGASDPRMIAGAASMAALSGCRTRVLADTERMAESELTCQVGNQTQTTRVTLRRVDERTISYDTVSTFPNAIRATSHSTAVYEGTCTASSKAANQPSAEECTELRASLADMADAGSTCAQMPADLQAQCRARIAAVQQMAQAAVARCR